MLQAGSAALKQPVPTNRQVPGDMPQQQQQPAQAYAAPQQAPLVAALQGYQTGKNAQIVAQLNQTQAQQSQMLAALHKQQAQPFPSPLPQTTQPTAAPTGAPAQQQTGQPWFDKPEQAPLVSAMQTAQPQPGYNAQAQPGNPWAQGAPRQAAVNEYQPQDPWGPGAPVGTAWNKYDPGF